MSEEYTLKYHLCLEQLAETIKELDKANERIEEFNTRKSDDGWISVDERLPEDETPTLILFTDGTREIGELVWDNPSFEDTYEAFRYWDSPTDDGKMWEWHDITHWQPLPLPPKEDK